MCGIAGICNLTKPNDISMETLMRMIKVIQNRGPDETGIYLDDYIGLGHARLSIIDLANGTQPIHNENENLWIVYNGEIYNYPELRKQLREGGHHFYTTTDTEVILHLYEEYGADCLNHLNGQFAMAIWDMNQKELFLARDRVGIRPLYYTLTDNTLIFASEIKSIFQNKQVSRQIDPIAMDQIFTFWTTLSPRTVFENILELPPGHYMMVSGGKVTLKKYWEIPFQSPLEHTNLHPEDISDQLRELLLNATKIRLRADVPVGCYLSGGLDSSAVAGMVADNFNRNVKTFGIRFEQAAFDEGEHQKRMVSWLDVNHSEILATNEKIGACLPECIWHCEKPLLRTAPIPLFILSRLVNNSGLKVVLTGEGADEIFGGYNIFRETKIRRFWARYPDSKNRAELISQLYPYVFNNPRLKQTLQSFFAKGLENPDDPLFSHMIRWGNTSKTKRFFSRELREAIGDYSVYDSLTMNLPSDYETWDYLSKAQYLEMTIFLSNYLLSSQGDRVAMAHSVEIRLPYLDPRVIEFMSRIPAKWKIMGLNEKHILKKTFRDILPKEIIRRPKHPYRAPIKQSLLNAKTNDYAREMLSETSVKRTGLFDSNKVTTLLRKIQATERPGEVDSMALIGILSSQLVYRQFIENFPVVTDIYTPADLMIDKRTKAFQYQD